MVHRVAYSCVVHVVAILSMICCRTIADHEIYCVTPTSNISCSKDNVPCFTLSQYATKCPGFFSSNSTLILLPGSHSLDVEFVSENMTYLALTKSVGLTPSFITCTAPGKFRFESIEQVVLSGLNIYGCVNNTITSMHQFTLADCTFHGLGYYGTGLFLNRISSAEIIKRSFDSFRSKVGGAISIHSSCMSIHRSLIRGNNAKVSGEGVYATNANITVQNSTFINNTVTVAGMHGKGGGALYVLHSNTFIENTMFINNTVSVENDVNAPLTSVLGGAFCASNSSVLIGSSTFFGNIVRAKLLSLGGAFASLNFTVVNMISCTFCNNTSSGSGGAVAFQISECNLHDIFFMANNALLFGGAVYTTSTNLSVTGYIRVFEDNNINGAVFMHTSTANFTGNITLLHNQGGLYAYSSTVFLLGDSTSIFNGTNFNNASLGNALTCYQSKITFAGTTDFMYNTGLYFGGGIFAHGYTLDIYGDITIAHNSASQLGGGICAYQSQVNFRGNVAVITRNEAGENGGGIYAAASTVNFYSGNLQLVQNYAKRGGGMYLEQNVQLLLKKNRVEYVFNGTLSSNEWLRLEFINNTAYYYGGALFVNDTSSSACSSEFGLSTECFVQSLILYDISTLLNDIDLFLLLQALNVENIYFSDNSARIAGGNIYGGLLDRCRLSIFSEVQPQFSTGSVVSPGLELLIPSLTNLKKSLYSTAVMSSEPVRVHFCTYGQPNKTYCDTPSACLMHVMKGQTFRIPVVAVDQAGNPVASTIVSSPENGLLARGQVEQELDASCMLANFTLYSPKNTSKLHLYAKGPCNNIGISDLSLEIRFEDCPIGFEESQVEGCVCDNCLFSTKLITNCSIDRQSVLRKGSVWIGFDVTSMEYITHRNCPFDYCNTTEGIYINLSISDGSDKQCAFNRSNMLCGSCKEKLSLTLGTSHCKKCSNTEFSLLIVFAALGIILVLLILFVNLTVAFGTINGLIFYANIIAANGAVFLSISNFLTVFIAWLNLDFGIEACFYDGLDGYVNVWLQLAFPAYLIFLVFMVIILARFSRRFAKLLSTRNPVATLATLIFLSYTKLLRTVLAALSFAKLQYYTRSECQNRTVFCMACRR